jgi:hypothetical protein
MIMTVAIKSRGLVGSMPAIREISDHGCPLSRMFPYDRYDLLLKTEGYQNRVSRNGRDWCNCGHVWYCQCRRQTLDGGSAATDITVINSEISQFCVVFKQIQSILEKAGTNVQYSITALMVWWGSMVTPVGTPDFGAIVLPVPIPLLYFRQFSSHRQQLSMLQTKKQDLCER